MIKSLRRTFNLMTRFALHKKKFGDEQKKKAFQLNSSLRFTTEFKNEQRKSKIRYSNRNFYFPFASNKVFFARFGKARHSEKLQMRIQTMCHGAAVNMKRAEIKIERAEFCEL